MTYDKFVAAYQKAFNDGDEYLKFDRVNPKRSQRPDLHAFLLLDELAPKPGKDMVGSASDGEIYLNANLENLAAVITEEQIVELLRCGVLYHESYDCLMMNA